MQFNIEQQAPFEIWEENIAILDELREFSASICNIGSAINLLESTRNDLVLIKKKVGNIDYYINLSTIVVDKALSCVIQEVNEIQKDKSEENLAQVVHSAWEAIVLMDSFDKEKNFAVHYLSNRETLSEIYKQIIISNSVYHEMLEYYRAIDVFCGTVKKKDPISSKQDTSDIFSDAIEDMQNVIGEMHIPTVVSRDIPGLDSETKRLLQFQKIDTFLNNALKPLRRIKNSQSINQQEYLKLSIRVVSLALHKVLVLVNNCNSSPRFQYGLYTDLNFTVLEAYKVFLKMSSFDMDEDFKKHFDKQKSIIKQMADRIMKPSQISSSNRGNNSGCMVMLCSTVVLIIFTFYYLVKI